MNADFREGCITGVIALVMLLGLVLALSLPSGERCIRADGGCVVVTPNPERGTM